MLIPPRHSTELAGDARFGQCQHGHLYQLTGMVGSAVLALDALGHAHES